MATNSHSTGDSILDRRRYYKQTMRVTLASYISCRRTRCSAYSPSWPLCFGREYCLSGTPLYHNCHLDSCRYYRRRLDSMIRLARWLPLARYPSRNAQSPCVWSRYRLGYRLFLWTQPLPLEGYSTAPRTHQQRLFL